MINRVIYTCLTDNRDSLLDPLVVRKNWDYICFSNHLNPDHYNIWNIKKIKTFKANKQVSSRYPKLNPHLVLGDYDYSVYIDSNIRITGDYIYNKAEELIYKGANLALVKHPIRDCIYNEAEVCINEGMDSRRIINEQLNFYRSENYPIHNGLFENNLIFRAHMNPYIIKLSNAWWHMYLKYAKRDQLSLSYLLWKYKIPNELIFDDGSSTRNHAGFQYLSHNNSFYRRFKKRVRIFLNKI